MVDLFTEYLKDTDPDILIALFAIIIIICCAVFKNRSTIQEFWNNLYNMRKNKEDLLKTIHDNQAQIKELMENRIHDRQQSFVIQKDLTDAQKELASSIAAISKKLDNIQRSTEEKFLESEQKNNKRIRAELKDKISQSYRYYHSLGKINDMELDALEDLIEEYESAAGENSFVHSVVQKEMYTWEKADRI